MITVRIKSFLVAVAGLVTVVLSISMGWGISQVLRLYADNLGRLRDNASPQYLAKAAYRESIGDEDGAFWNLQMAVANAVDNSQKSSAALGMAEFLLHKAAQNPMPFALMGKQYCEAVLDIETDKAIRYRTCRVLVDLAALLRDSEAVEEALREGIKASPTREDAALFIIRKLEMLLDTREVGAFGTCLEEAQEYFDVPGVSNQVVFGKARLLAILNEYPDCAKEWFGGEDLVRRQEEFADYLRLVEADLQNIADTGSIADSGEALYQMARLKILVEDFASAQNLFEKFLMTESNAHQEDVLMHMAIIARHENKVGRAERLLDIFIKRFSWNKVAVGEFLNVVKEMVARQRQSDALNLVDKYLSAGLSGDFEAQLLHFAAKTSMDAGMSDRAEAYYRRIYDLNADTDLIIESLLVRGRIFKDAGDYEKAISLLMEYLVSFPYEAKRGDAYFDVFDLERRAGRTSPATLISIASAAALEKPEDPRTKRALLEVAGILEEMELYEMARDRYGRIALLHYVSDMQSSISVSEGSLVYVSTLGAGRCYYKMGDLVQADSVFRDLCNSMPPSSVRSEAAYYWAQIALKNGQIPEAKRRLELVGDDVGVLLAAESSVDKALIAVKEHGCSRLIYQSLIDAINSVSEESARRGLWLRFSLGCMDEMEAAKDLNAMEEFFQWASGGECAALLPLRQIHMRLGSMLIQNRGVDEYGVFLQRTKALMSADSDYTKVISSFMALVENIDSLKLSRDAVL